MARKSKFSQRVWSRRAKKTAKVRMQLRVKFATFMLESSEAYPGPYFSEAKAAETVHKHFIGDGEPEGNSRTSYNRSTRHHNIPPFVGTLFVMLITSILGVFAPMLLGRVVRGRVSRIALIAVSQFGARVIVATATIHVRLSSSDDLYCSVSDHHVHSCSPTPNSCSRMSALLAQLT
jgi:hypothetical protein